MKSTHSSARRVAAWLGISVALVLGPHALSIAQDAALEMFSPGEVLTAAKLNGHFAELERRLRNVEATVPKFQIGSENCDSLDEAWILEEQVNPDGRSYTRHVDFSSAFAVPPVVEVALKSLDTSAGFNTRLTVNASNVTATGFDIVIATWSDSIVYSANVLWVASTSGSALEPAAPPSAQ
jgi:hypothetical protein